jgi:hypothetical protein
MCDLVEATRRQAWGLYGVDVAGRSLVRRRLPVVRAHPHPPRHLRACLLRTRLRPSRSATTSLGESCLPAGSTPHPREQARTARDRRSDLAAPDPRDVDIGILGLDRQPPHPHPLARRHRHNADRPVDQSLRITGISTPLFGPVLGQTRFGNTRTSPLVDVYGSGSSSSNTDTDPTTKTVPSEVKPPPSLTHSPSLTNGAPSESHSNVPPTLSLCGIASRTAIRCPSERSITRSPDSSGRASRSTPDVAASLLGPTACKTRR